MFTRVKPLGWAFLEILTSTQMNQLDTNASRAIDGLNGGVYTLAVMLELAGAGVKFSTVAEFEDAAVAFTGVGSVTVGSGTAWTFNNPVLFNALATLNGSATVPSGQTLTIADGASMQVDLAGAITNNGVLQNVGILYNDGRIINRGEGRLQRRFTALPDANGAVVIADGQVFLMPTTALGARVYTLDTTGIENNDELEFRQFDFHIGSVGHQVLIGAGTITFGSQATPGSVSILYVKRIAGQWRTWTDRYP
jgi:hypothetical protein